MLHKWLVFLIAMAWGAAGSVESQLERRRAKLQAALAAKKSEIEIQESAKGSEGAQHFVIRNTVIKISGGDIFWRDILDSQGYTKSPHRIPVAAKLGHVAEENEAETILAEDLESGTVTQLVLTLKGEPYLTTNKLPALPASAKYLIKGSFMAVQSGREVQLYGKDYVTSLGNCLLDSETEQMVAVAYSPKKSCLFVLSQSSVYFFDKSKRRCFQVHQFPDPIADGRLISSAEGETLVVSTARRRQLVLWRFKSHNQLSFERKVRFRKPGQFVGNNFFVVEKRKNDVVVSLERWADGKPPRIAISRLTPGQKVLGGVMLDEITRIFTADPQTGFLEHRVGVLGSKFQPFKDIKIPKIVYLILVVLSITWVLSYLKRRQERLVKEAREQAAVKQRATDAKNRQINTDIRTLSASISQLKEAWNAKEAKLTHLR